MIQKLANVFDVTIDYFVSDTDEDFMEVRIVDKSLMERVKLIDSLDEEDKTALIRVIDSILTKKKYLIWSQRKTSLKVLHKTGIFKKGRFPYGTGSIYLR